MRRRRAKKHTDPVAAGHPAADATQRLTEPPGDQLPALMVDLSRQATSRKVTATDVADAVAATCAKGTVGVAEGLHPRATARRGGRRRRAVRARGRAHRRAVPARAGPGRSSWRAPRSPSSRSTACAPPPTGRSAERELNQQACAVMVSSEQSVGEIVDGLSRVATRHLERRRALEIGVKAVVQACPVFIGDLRRRSPGCAVSERGNRRGVAGVPRACAAPRPRHPRRPRAARRRLGQGGRRADGLRQRRVPEDHRARGAAGLHGRRLRDARHRSAAARSSP